MKPTIIHRTTQAELTPSETLYTDSIDYLLGGALTLRNGRIDQYQFDEGYCQVSSSTSTTDTFILFYYEKDHLGNIRKVRKVNRTRNGEVVQGSNYYPFGAEFCDNTANYSVQSRKYNGKEFDNMHGLNTYDYGARQYNPVTARWDRMDRFCEKYYSNTPYGYCGNNPINYIDINGDSIWVNIGKTNLLFDNGLLYNSDGSLFNGKNKYANKVLTALNNIISNGGNEIIESLSQSDKNFIIKKGKNAFRPDNTNNATVLINAENNNVDIASIPTSRIGAGGTITWKPNNKYGGPDSTGKMKRDSYIGLAHEFGHAFDASQGRLDLRKYAPNHPDEILRDVTYSEFNAMRFENIIRANSQTPLRIAYSKDSNRNLFMTP